MLPLMLRCLPRLGVGAITALLRDQFRVSQTFSHYASQCLNESTLVIIFAFVKPKCLLVEIPKQMKRLDVDVSSMKGTFQKRPEVFQSVRVDMALRITNGMVNNSSVVVVFKIVIRHKRISADSSALLDILANVTAKLRSARGANYLQNHARVLVRSCPFQDALYSSFLKPCVSNTRAFIFVHVSSFGADVGFVCFTSALHFREAALLHSEPDALQHEPRGVLSYSDITRDLVGTDSILAVSSEPHCRKPLVQSNWRIFKDRSNFNGKFLPRMVRLALPQFCVGKERHFTRTASRTHNTGSPANVFKEVVASLGIAEISNRLQEGFMCVHAINLHQCN